MSYKLAFPAPVGTKVVHIDGSPGEIVYLTHDAEYGTQVGVVLVGGKRASERACQPIWWIDVAEFDSEWRIVSTEH